MYILLQSGEAMSKIHSFIVNDTKLMPLSAIKFLLFDPLRSCFNFPPIKQF